MDIQGVSIPKRLIRACGSRATKGGGNSKISIIISSITRKVISISKSTCPIFEAYASRTRLLLQFL